MLLRVRSDNAGDNTIFLLKLEKRGHVQILQTEGNVTINRNTSLKTTLAEHEQTVPPTTSLNCTEWTTTQSHAPLMKILDHLRMFFLGFRCCTRSHRTPIFAQSFIRWDNFVQLEPPQSGTLDGLMLLARKNPLDNFLQHSHQQHETKGPLLRENDARRQLKKDNTFSTKRHATCDDMKHQEKGWIATIPHDSKKGNFDERTFFPGQKDEVKSMRQPRARAHFIWPSTRRPRREGRKNENCDKRGKKEPAEEGSGARGNWKKKFTTMELRVFFGFDPGFGSSVRCMFDSFESRDASVAITGLGKLPTKVVSVFTIVAHRIL